MVVKISVIIPVYNVQDYLDTCLNSIINQTLKDIEIICVNDGSSDNSLEILNKFASNDDRFIIINQENCGQGIARNKALARVKGQYIAFVDPDDWLELNALECVYNFAEKSNAEVVQFDFKIFDDAFNEYKNVSLSDNLQKIYKRNFQELLSFNWRDFKSACLQNLDLHAWTRLYRTDFVKKYNLKFAPAKRAEDHLFVIGAILLADKIFYYKDYLYNYRCRITSTVNSKSKDNFQIFQILDLMREFIANHGLYSELKDELQVYNRTILGWHYKQTPLEELDKYLAMCKEYLSDDDYKKMIKDVNKKRSFWENLFSLKNKRENGVKYKIITVLGTSFCLKATAKD